MSALTEHDFLACTLSEWGGDPTRCRWCDLPLWGHKTFCCLECKRQAVENHAWATAKLRVRLRDRGCVGCGATRRLEVHHREPCAGHRAFGCQHHLDNLELRCDQCHDETHRTTLTAAADEAYERDTA